MSANNGYIPNKHTMINLSKSEKKLVPCIMCELSNKGLKLNISKCFAGSSTDQEGNATNNTTHPILLLAASGCSNPLQDTASGLPCCGIQDMVKPYTLAHTSLS